MWRSFTFPSPGGKGSTRPDRYYMEGKNVLVGATGSVATIKLPELVKKLVDLKLNVQVVVTKSALHFVDLKDIPVKCHVDADEWDWTKKGDPVLHIELRKWADMFVITPLDANTLAKMAMGLCDNLLTCVVRAWDLQRPLVYCPAMNTFMWDHPLTATHIETLSKFGYIQVPPVSKRLACGDLGVGAMASVDDIVKTIISSL